MSIRIAQLSDTHFLEADADPEGGFAYDTNQAFDAVLDHITTQPDLDFVVVTGDVADHGRPAQYRLALDAFDRLPVPVMVTPGNHDQDAPFTVGMGSTKVTTPRVVHHDNWCFVFVDSNAGVMIDDGTGHRVDPAYNDRLHTNGNLGAAEAAWLQQVCATTEAEHVFIWLHHPPIAGFGPDRDLSYDQQWVSLLPELPKVRGLGAGHTHMPGEVECAGLPVFVCPAFKNNFDLEANTLLPPGYRTYSFEPDGTVTSEAHMTDDERWPRNPLPRSVAALLRGELSFDQFNEIVARKARG